MRQIRVHIREKDKGGKQLTLFNLREEIVGFLYRDTIANSTKTDLQFYIFMYFAVARVGKKSLLEQILDEALPKFENLNKSFTNRRGILRAREYRELVEQNGLVDLFKNDLFFILAESVLSIDRIDAEFRELYQDDQSFIKTIESLKTNYRPKVEKSYSTFVNTKIKDDRYDENGNYHDLSKSVYRTVRMRSSRNLNLNLQKYTSIKTITSQSPIDLTFIQYVDPQILIDLWDKYHVAQYMKSVWDAIESSPTVSGAVGGTFSGGVLHLANKYSKWKNTNGAQDRKAKEAAKAEFQTSLKKTQDIVEGLTLKLVDSVLETNKTLQQEIKHQREQLRIEQEKRVKTDSEIKRMKDRIAELENLEVESKIVNDDAEV